MYSIIQSIQKKFSLPKTPPTPAYGPNKVSNYTKLVGNRFS